MEDLYLPKTPSLGTLHRKERFPGPANGIPAEFLVKVDDTGHFDLESDYASLE